MRTTELTGNLRQGTQGVATAYEYFGGYEQRLIQWGCFNCRFFEKRVFSSGVIHEELDAYVICRFAGEPIDLIGEATTCPKDCKPLLPDNKGKSRWRRRHCVYKA